MAGKGSFLYLCALNILATLPLSEWGSHDYNSLFLVNCTQILCQECEGRTCLFGCDRGKVGIFKDHFHQLEEKLAIKAPEIFLQF